MMDKYKIVFRRNIEGAIKESLTVSEEDMLGQVTILTKNGYKIVSVRLNETPNFEDVEEVKEDGKEN